MEPKYGPYVRKVWARATEYDMVIAGATLAKYVVRNSVHIDLTV